MFKFPNPQENQYFKTLVEINCDKGIERELSIIAYRNFLLKDVIDTTPGTWSDITTDSAMWGVYTEVCL